MVYIRQKAKADTNPESPPIIQHEINICEVPTTSQAVFTAEQNKLFVQRVVQDDQVLEDEVFYYNILGLNEYTTDDDLKNPIINWLFDTALK